MMTFEEWRAAQFKHNPKLRRSSETFLRQMYTEQRKRQGGGSARGDEEPARAQPVRWRPLLLQLAVCFVCTVALAALDDATRSLPGLTHYEYMPAWALFAFVFLPATTVARIAYYAYCEHRAYRLTGKEVTESGGQSRGSTGARRIEDTSGLRPTRGRVLLLQIAVSFACTVALVFMDDEAHSFWDLMRLENVPAMVLYTLGFFGITMFVRVTYHAYRDHRAYHAYFATKAETNGRSNGLAG